MKANKTQISKEEYEIVCNEIKKKKNKNIVRRLTVIKLLYENYTNKYIAKKLDYSEKYITELSRTFKNQGIELFIKNKQVGNHRTISFENEAKILASFTQKSEQGIIITPHEIKEELEIQSGKAMTIGNIYKILKRHNWRMVMPRSKHPKVASKEEQDSSKKLNPST